MSGIPGFGIVRSAARAVPWRRRAEWQAEWEGELSHVWSTSAGTRSDRTKLQWRALGAWQDALEVRRQYGGSPMIGNDLTYAVRLMARRPRFTAAVVLTLALGIGGAAAVYTLIDRLVLHPAAFDDIDTVGELHTQMAPGTTIPILMVDGVEKWRAQGTVFADVQAYGYTGSILGGAGEPQRVTVALVMPGLLPMLGAQPLLGRIPAANATNEIVIAESLWRNELGGTANVLGMTLRLDDQPYTVAGVMPAAFRYPVGEPAAWRIEQLGNEMMTQVQVVARVQPGHTREQIEAEVARIGERLNAEATGQFPFTVQLRWLADSQLRPEFQSALWVLAGAVLLVLLIACVNAANLLLVNMTRRDQELAIRGAIGATRMQLVRQLVLESVVLGIVSAAAGLLIARWLVQVVVTLAPRELMLSALRTVEVDVSAVLFATLLAILAAVLYSLVPSLRAARNADLVHAPRATGGGSVRLTRGALLVAEVALSVVLLSAAGLLLNSFMRLTRTDLGFQPQGLIEFAVHPRVGGEAFLAEVEERLRGMPQVASLARGDAAPSEASMSVLDYVLQPYGVPDHAVQKRAGMLPLVHVDTAYLRVIGATIREGRNLLPEDALTGGVLIDSDLAQALWPNESAVGRRFRVSKRAEDWWHVVGVTGDVRMLGADEGDAPFVVFRHATAERRGAFFIIRTAGDTDAAAQAIRTLLREMDAGLPIPDIRNIPESMRSTFAERRFFMLIIGGFAVVSTILAITGLYGVISHAVAQRTREIGIRMALGAHSMTVLRDVLASGAALISGGVVLGVGAALAASGVLRTLLFGVPPRDPLTFAAVALTVFLVAMVAVLVPARRAATIEPLQALRYE
jgi:putative ABC transport system permease protein